MKKHVLLPRAALLIILFTISVTTSVLYAAEVTASLTGAVNDSSGAVVSGATLTLTNTATNVSSKQTSGADGRYLFKLVPAGTYELAVEHSGFEKYVQRGIILQVNQNAKQDVSLKVGAASQVVEVNANVAQVDTVGATLGSVETSRRIVDLPLV